MTGTTHHSAPIRYTAREGGDSLRNAAVGAIAKLMEEARGWVF